MAKNLKIAFVSNRDPKDVRSWSGTPFFMANALRQAGHSVTLIGPLNIPCAGFYKAIRKVFGLFGKFYDPERTRWVVSSYARQVENQIKTGRFDVVLSTSTLPLAYLRTNVPKVCWVDASFGGMLGFYPDSWSSMSHYTIKDGMRLDTQAFSNIDLAMFCSDWAAETAVQHHDAKPSRVRVNPLGANTAEVPSAETVVRFIQGKSTACCRLLFVGVEWERKGGDLVVETARLLKAKGVNVEVDIVGCQPPTPQPDYVTCHGFISKATEQGRQRLTELMAQAHYLFVPSVAECFGLVYAEAAAHGLPSIARPVGGVPNAVSHGISGYLLAKDAGAAQYAELIQSGLGNKPAYDELAMSARCFYETSLTWQSAIDRFELMFDECFNRAAMASKP